MAVAATFAMVLTAAVVVAALVREGFRNGDRPEDPVVTATVLPLPAGERGCRVEVAVDNPSPSPALMALAVAPTLRWWAAVERRTARAGYRVPVQRPGRLVGVVPAGASGRFRVWAVDDARSHRLDVAVGTSGRLRLHRIPVEERWRDRLSAAPPAAAPRRPWPATG